MTYMTNTAKIKETAIAITWGDPAGIGPEVVIKSFLGLPAALQKRITVFGDLSHFSSLARRMRSSLKIVDAKKCAATAGAMAVYDSASFPFDPSRYGKISKTSGRAAMQPLEAAIALMLEGRFAALVTAPINKEAVNLAGYRIAGHTEFLAAKCGGAPVAMMLASRKLKVVVATTHVPLSDVAGLLDKRKLADFILLVARGTKKYGIASPRIAVCGLNPHASDGGIFGREEASIISPAIHAARKAGVNATGPHPADTMFTAAARKNYDVAIAMYHDQGLIPVKALSFGETVNVTLGLPFLRVSVDHGTAFDIAGKGVADWRPMAYAIRTAARMNRGRF